MKRAVCILLLLLSIARPVRAQTAFLPSVTSPASGQAVQGVVTITGTTALEGFVSADLSFAYGGDPTGTWFPIAASNTPVFEDTLAAWDTSTITDGNYLLRLRVLLSDGTLKDVLVEGLRVRNYTSVETPTPAATVERPTPVLTATPTVTPWPTPTPLPRNPAAIDPADVRTSIAGGGAAALLAFALLGIYLWLRRK